MVSVMRLIVRSITTLAMPPFWIRASIYFLIFWSSTSLSENSFPPNQLESQPRTMPRRKPTGLIFCPIIPWFLFEPSSFLLSLLQASCRPRVLRGWSACARGVHVLAVLDAIFSACGLRQHALLLQRDQPLPTSRLYFSI